MKYDADYFIKFFRKIPDEKWTTHALEENGGHCALGHCGAKEGRIAFCRKAMALYRVLCRKVAFINDGAEKDYPQKTPKARILAALKDAKEAGR